MRKKTLDAYFGDEGDAQKKIGESIDISTKTIQDGIPSSVTPGAVVNDTSVFYEVELVAGVTYSFAQRPTAEGGMVDPLMILYDADGNFITYDDDGGAGLGSLLSYTPTTSGTYYVEAGSWGAGDNGNFEFVRWDSTQPDAGDTLATATEIGLGLTTGSRLARSDVDMYKINLEGGEYYTFAVSGGRDGAGETGITAQVELLNASGTVVASHYGNESGVGFKIPTDGTYYVRVTPHPTAGATKGGYTLDVAQIDLASKSPLEALNWDSANNVPAVDTNGDGKGDTCYVYFGLPGENFGQSEPNNPAVPMATYGWTQAQKDAVMTALHNEYTPITGLNYVVTENQAQATFRLCTTINQVFGARFYPQDPSSGSLQGVGSFNLISGGFGTDPGSLLEGGFSYAVVLHEFGHAHGVAHPHDNGGGSEVMAGVFSSTGSYGAYDLNQGIYTVMSYNDGWPLDPDGLRAYSSTTRQSGWSASLSALDVAVLQNRYGAHANNDGATTYTISDSQATAKYECIWDTSGNDTIQYTGTKNAQIDLLAATLDYSATGGGVVSYAHGVWGGFTIANGVVIENATGGSGNDVLLGNSANNVLTGNDGNDSLLGREGKDLLVGGIGNDTFTGGDGIDVVQSGAGADLIVAEVTASKSAFKGANKGNMSYDVVTDFAKGSDHIDLSHLGQAMTFHGTDAVKNAGDLTYKVFDSINGAEKALGIEIDGHAGAGGVGGPVTVVYGDVNGGGADFAIVLLNTNGVSTTDFIYGG